MDDVEVLRSFVEKYDLTSKIGTAWPSLLNEEESLLLTIIGRGRGRGGPSELFASDENEDKCG